MPFNRSRPEAIAFVVLAALGAGGCGAGDLPADRADRVGPVGDAARVVAADPVEAPAGDPESVVVAAMILATGGDLDVALADGVVTRRDVERARSGLADGSLDGLFD